MAEEERAEKEKKTMKMKEKAAKKRSMQMKKKKKLQEKALNKKLVAEIAQERQERLDAIRLRSIYKRMRDDEAREMKKRERERRREEAKLKRRERVEERKRKKEAEQMERMAERKVEAEEIQFMIKRMKDDDDDGESQLRVDKSRQAFEMWKHGVGRRRGTTPRPFRLSTMMSASAGDDDVSICMDPDVIIEEEVVGTGNGRLGNVERRKSRRNRVRKRKRNDAAVEMIDLVSDDDGSKVEVVSALY